MKTGYKVLLGAVVLVGAGAFVYMKYFNKTQVFALTDGSGTIYMKNGQYYLNVNGDEALIPDTEYNTLKNKVEGSCSKPSDITTSDITPCTYYGYKGYIDSCGACAILAPITRDCAPTAGACTSGTKSGTLIFSDADSKNCHYTCYVTATT